MIYINAMYFSVDKEDLLKSRELVNNSIEKIMEALKTVPDLSFRKTMTMSINPSFETNNVVVSLSFN